MHTCEPEYHPSACQAAKCQGQEARPAQRPALTRSMQGSNQSSKRSSPEENGKQHLSESPSERRLARFHPCFPICLVSTRYRAKLIFFLNLNLPSARQYESLHLTRINFLTFKLLSNDHLQPLTTPPNRKEDVASCPGAVEAQLK